MSRINLGEVYYNVAHDFGLPQAEALIRDLAFSLSKSFRQQIITLIRLRDSRRGTTFRTLTHLRLF